MKYNRVLLKLSGESLAGNQDQILDNNILKSYARQIVEISRAGCQIGIVIGGGNIFRGLAGAGKGTDRVKGDQMGMLATIINSIALENAINSGNGKAKVYTSIRMEPVGELYTRDKVTDAMKNGIITVIGGGTGNPFFTTDTASALRAVELECDVLLKGTRVDGVYSDDPEKVSDAERFSSISFDEVIDRRLKVMDITAFTMCRENSLPVVVFNMNEEGALMKVIMGEDKGTLVHM